MPCKSPVSVLLRIYAALNKILLTGSTGFIGFAVLSRLSLDAQHELLLAARHRLHDLNSSVVQYQVADIDGTTRWYSATYGVDVIIDCAALAHVMNVNARSALAEFRQVNVEGTLNLVR